MIEKRRGDNWLKAHVWDRVALGGRAGGSSYRGLAGPLGGGSGPWDPG